MPVTKTAKRALRGSTRKLAVNKLVLKRLELAVRKAKKTRSRDKILEAISLADKAAKKRTIHKNKAARIKSGLSKLLSGRTSVKKSSGAKPKPKKASKSPKKK